MACMITYTGILESRVLDREPKAARNLMKYASDTSFLILNKLL